MSKQQKLKGATYVVEIIQNQDDSRTFIVRTPQGYPLEFLHAPEELATFFNECEI